MTTETQTHGTHGGKREGSGRSPLPSDEVKKNRSIKLSDAEWGYIKREASRQGLSASEYIRDRVL